MSQLCFLGRTNACYMGEGFSLPVPSFFSWPVPQIGMAARHGNNHNMTGAAMFDLVGPQQSTAPFGGALASIHTGADALAACPGPRAPLADKAGEDVLGISRLVPLHPRRPTARLSHMDPAIRAIPTFGTYLGHLCPHVPERPAVGEILLGGLASAAILLSTLAGSAGMAKISGSACG